MKKLSILFLFALISCNPEKEDTEQIIPVSDSAIQEMIASDSLQRKKEGK